MLVTPFFVNSCSVCADCHLPGTVCMWTDCTTCFESCASMAGECGCLGGAGEAGLPLLFIMALVVLGLFTVIGIFYSVLVATMVGQRIWQRHYHILAKRMLTKVSRGALSFHCVFYAAPILIFVLQMLELEVMFYYWWGLQTENHLRAH